MEPLSLPGEAPNEPVERLIHRLQAMGFSFEVNGVSVPGSGSQGPWAWFRLLDKAQVERLSDARYRITFSAGGHAMRVLLEAASSRNPFGPSPFAGFRCAM